MPDLVRAGRQNQIAGIRGSQGLLLLRRLRLEIQEGPPGCKMIEFWLSGFGSSSIQLKLSGRRARVGTCVQLLAAFALEKGTDNAIDASYRVRANPRGTET